VLYYWQGAASTSCERRSGSLLASWPGTPVHLGPDSESGPGSPTRRPGAHLTQAAGTEADGAELVTGTVYPDHDDPRNGFCAKGAAAKLGLPGLRGDTRLPVHFGAHCRVARLQGPSCVLMRVSGCWTLGSWLPRHGGHSTSGRPRAPSHPAGAGPAARLRRVTVPRPCPAGPRPSERTRRRREWPAADTAARAGGPHYPPWQPGPEAGALGRQSASTSGPAGAQRALEPTNSPHRRSLPQEL
jgi:hypothetical protein